MEGKLWNFPLEPPPTSPWNIQKIPAPQRKEPGNFLNDRWREAHKPSVDTSQQKDRNPHADNVKTRILPKQTVFFTK